MSEIRHQPTLPLVDDEAHILGAVRRVLRDQPYERLTAASGAAALVLLNAGKRLGRPLIDKLIAFEASEGARYLVHVRLPEADASPAKE